jgi:hypothetical protein
MLDEIKVIDYMSKQYFNSIIIEFEYDQLTELEHILKKHGFNIVENQVKINKQMLLITKKNTFGNVLNAYFISKFFKARDFDFMLFKNNLSMNNKKHLIYELDRLVGKIKDINTLYSPKITDYTT